MIIGDRVTRLGRAVFEEKARHGIIVDKYKSRLDGNRNFTYLYAVKWDDSEVIEKGYLEVGLEKEEA